MKLEKLIKESNVNSYDLTKYTGSANRTDSLESILSGKREITATNLNLLTSFARGLGVQLTDILEDYQLDGTQSQIIGLNRQIDRIKKYKKGKLIYSDSEGGFILGANLPNSNYNNFTLLKTDYEFLNPDLKHSEQKVTPVYILNRKWNERNKQRYTSRNKTLTNLDARINKRALSFIIYTPLKNSTGEIIGGDLKTAVSVFNTNKELMFSEIYGVEFIDLPENKDIHYYKSRNIDFAITPKRIERWKKQEISELEFYKALFSQYYKFNIVS